MTEDVLFETRGPIGLITLNRPKALNALNLAMIDAMSARLVAWAADPAIAAVVVRGAGDRGFCAGGDLRAVYEAGERAARFAIDEPERDFFRKEYVYNWRIHHFPKPYVALIDGITMGGGVGASVHGSHRVAGEKLVFAMPETAIGFFPDVGGSWFLNRCPGETGTYAALTGARLGVADALHLGIATDHVPGERFEALIDALAAADYSGDARAAVDGVIAGFRADAGAATLPEHRAAIDAAFGHDRMEAILGALAADGSPWAAETAETLAGKSPTSLKVSLAQLRRGRGLAYDDCVTMEYRMSQAFLRGHDLFEGIRAIVVDKDRNAAWDPPDLSGVDDATVAAYFEPGEAEDLIPR
ncbi:MAG: enoyl-CoA hydratase/isomerase family protein [Azospirillaceae bacterium]